MSGVPDDASMVEDKLRRAMGPKITTEVYGHVVPGFPRDAIDQLKLENPTPFVTRLLPAAEKAGEAPNASPENNPASDEVDWRALLDSNQWPSASETDA